MYFRLSTDTSRLFCRIGVAVSPGPACPVAITTVSCVLPEKYPGWKVSSHYAYSIFFFFSSNKVGWEWKAVSWNFLNLTPCVPSNMTKPILIAKTVHKKVLSHQLWNWLMLLKPPRNFCWQLRLQFQRRNSCGMCSYVKKCTWFLLAGAESLCMRSWKINVINTFSNWFY